MSSNRARRLADAEKQTDSTRAGYVFLTEREDGLYESSVTGRAYTEDQVLELVHQYPDTIFNITGRPGSIPPDPYGPLPGMTLEDARLMNVELEGGTLSAEETARLEALKRSQAERAEAYEAYMRESEPFHEEMLRRAERLNRKR